MVNVDITGENAKKTASFSETAFSYDLPFFKTGMYRQSKIIWPMN
jgi:hypothetical protein